MPLAEGCSVWAVARFLSQRGNEGGFKVWESSPSLEFQASVDIIIIRLATIACLRQSAVLGLVWSLVAALFRRLLWSRPAGRCPALSGATAQCETGGLQSIPSYQ
jgi:hypothetical protein